MKVYRFSFTIDDEIVAETRDRAYRIVRELFQLGYYGPTRDNLEFDRELSLEGEEPTPES